MDFFGTLLPVGITTLGLNAYGSRVVYKNQA